MQYLLRKMFSRELPDRMMIDLNAGDFREKRVEELQKRAVEVAPVFEESGVENWTEFCVRYAHSIPGVLATVGATSRIENLDEFLAAKEEISPLPFNIVDKISSLQYRWSDELDMKAEPWTM